MTLLFTGTVTQYEEWPSLTLPQASAEAMADLLEANGGEHVPVEIHAEGTADHLEIVERALRLVQDSIGDLVAQLAALQPAMPAFDPESETAQAQVMRLLVDGRRRGTQKVADELGCTREQAAEVCWFLHNSGAIERERRSFFRWPSDAVRDVMTLNLLATYRRATTPARLNDRIQKTYGTSLALTTASLERLRADGTATESNGRWRAVGWASLEPLATDKSPQYTRWLGAFFTAD